MNTPKEKDKRRDPNAMDVDVNIIKTRLSKEERDKLAKEGRCFNCKKQGHMARQCPDKKKKSDKKGKDKKPFKAKGAQIEVVDDREENEEDKNEKEETPPAYEDIDSLVKKIRRLKTEDRGNLMDTLAEQDFS
jgi:hypothetical protein